jgi:hypothetical protein
MATMTTERPSKEQHFDVARRWQEHFDEALAPIGMRAPPPTLGMDVDTYRKEFYRLCKKGYLPPSHELARVNYRGLAPDALDTLGPQLLQACVDEYRNPEHLQPGELRAIEVRDPQTGRVQHRDWIGREHFTKAMGRAGRRVAQFITDHGRYNVAKARFE